MAVVSDKLTPEGKQFYASIEKLKNNEVGIGFQHGKKVHSAKNGGEALDMAQIAAFNEFGTSKSPPRPFLRMTVDNNQEKIAKFVEKETKRIASGASSEQVLNKLGAFGVGLVQETIGSGSFTPNAPSTVAMKGSSHPLIDTGQMRQSVHYVIKPKGSE